MNVQIVGVNGIQNACAREKATRKRKKRRRKMPKEVRLLYLSIISFLIIALWLSYKAGTTNGKLQILHQIPAVEEYPPVDKNDN